MTKKNKEKKNLESESFSEKKSAKNTESKTIKEDIKIEKKIEKLEKELEIAKEEKLRLLAEMENLRKRFEKEKTESIKYGSSNLARDILTPCDNLVRALHTIKEEEKENKNSQNLIDGLEMIYQEILSILKKHGIEKITALNKKFNHDYHQAMLEIDTDDIESGVVVKELQAGYTMHGRLLRPAMVGVSKKKEEKNK